MKLATYNIHSCIGADGRFAPARTAGVLRELGAGIVALQEVENPAVDDLALLERLADETNLEPIAGPTIELEARHYGNAILTTLPILEVNRIDLSLPRREPRGALDVLLEWRGRPLQVIATHLGLRPTERRDQVRRILSALDLRAVDYAVLLGDINEWALWGRPLRWLRRYFNRTPHLRTYPARFPLLSLDRIWARPRSALRNFEVHRSRLARTASDHLPLTAELH